MYKYLIPVIAFVSLSCSDLGPSPQERDFNILFGFGVGARNELDTFHNTYTKDLILDGTVTISLVLSDDQLQAIKEKLVEADFFTYPDTFIATVKDSLFVIIEPHSSYYFRVQYGATIKTLYWDDSVVPFFTDIRRRNLQDIVVFISDIISRRPEILSLPPARGGYL